MNADKVEIAVEPDIVAENYGSIWLLDARTGAGEAWIEENIEESAPFFGGKIVVEPRYVMDIIEGARESGLLVVL